MRRALAVAALTVLAIVAAGCGGDDSTTADSSATVTWADDLCSAVTTWRDELERIGSELTDVSSLSEDTLREAGSDASAATETLLDDVRSLGRPDTEAGTEAESLVETFADTVEAEKREVEDAIDGASGISGVASAVSTVATSLTTMLDEFQQTFDALRDLDTSGELQSAFEQAAACDPYVSS